MSTSVVHAALMVVTTLYQLCQSCTDYSAKTAMPQWMINTNVPRDAIPKDFVKEATDVFQQAIGKPIQVLCTICVI